MWPFCLESLPEFKVKSFGLIPSAEEISKQPSRDSVVWFLELTLLNIYNEKEQAEEIKVQMYRLINRGTRK